MNSNRYFEFNFDRIPVVNAAGFTLRILYFRASLANGGYDQEQFNEVSESAISCIQGLLVLDPVKRITAKQTLG